MILLFYHLTLHQNHALMMSLCMQLHFSKKIGKYHCGVFVFVLKMRNYVNVCFSSEG